MPRTREPRFGGRDEAGRLRFDAKHDDIYPIVADMIGYSYQVTARHSDLAAVTYARYASEIGQRWP